MQVVRALIDQINQCKGLKQDAALAECVKAIETNLHISELAVNNPIAATSDP